MILLIEFLRVGGHLRGKISRSLLKVLRRYKAIDHPPAGGNHARKITSKYSAVSEDLYEELWGELDDALDKIEFHPDITMIPPACFEAT